MLISCFAALQKFKSPLRVVAAILSRSRELKRQQLHDAQQTLRQLHRELKATQRQLQQTQEELRETQHQLQQAQHRSPDPAPDPSKETPLPHHCYGPRLIALCVTLAQQIGLRSVPKIMTILVDHLRIPQPVPHWTTVRGWMQRLGVAELSQPIEPADDWIWMLDHSAQTGPETILVVCGIRASQLPPPGTPLRHQDMTLLHIEAGVRWNKDHMSDVDDRLVETFGMPRCILTDGASELQLPAQALCVSGKRPVVLIDFKHRAANELKRLVGNTDRFREFVSQMTTTGHQVRRTALAHLAPPALKTKARFMNLKTLFDWGQRMLRLLESPEASCRVGVSAELLEEKLGWVRGFQHELEQWGCCQELLTRSLRFVNQQGLFEGACRALHAQFGEWIAEDTPLVCQLAARVLQFVKRSETQLNNGERLPMSTEILESKFALYKRLEGQHSKGGFTSLLAAFGSLGQSWTAQQVSEAFERVKVKDVTAWVKQEVGQTVAAQRRNTCHAHQTALASATKTTTTT